MRSSPALPRAGRMRESMPCGTACCCWRQRVGSASMWDWADSISSAGRSIARCCHEFLPGVKLRVCTAEDFIVLKTFAARPLDWRDVEMTIVRQGDAALDWHYIREPPIPLLELKEQPGLLDELDALRAKRLRHP